MPKSDQGVHLNRYTIIPRVLIFIFDGERVLLIKGAPNKKLWANLYNGIGGHIEKGEDVLTAARRELMEETGLSVEDLAVCGTLMVDASDVTGIGIFILKGTYSGGQLVDSGEGILEWILVDQIVTLRVVEDLPKLIPFVARWQKIDGIFSARSYYNDAGRLVVEVKK